MYQLTVVTPGMDLPQPNFFVAVVTHSEILQKLNLVVTDARLDTTPVHPDPNLHPGIVKHRKKQKSYYLNGVAYNPRVVSDVVWYSALYPSDDGLGPHWVRPIHCVTGAGWLDLVDGQLRFERITTEAVLLNRTQDHGLFD
jgi:hypothetical protein